MYFGCGCACVGLPWVAGFYVFGVWWHFDLVSPDSWFWFVSGGLCRVYVVWCSFYLDLGFLVFWVVWSCCLVAGSVCW